MRALALNELDHVVGGYDYMYEEGNGGGPIDLGPGSSPHSFEESDVDSLGFTAAEWQEISDYRPEMTRGVAVVRFASWLAGRIGGPSDWRVDWSFDFRITTVQTANGSETRVSGTGSTRVRSS